MPATRFVFGVCVSSLILVASSQAAAGAEPEVAAKIKKITLASIAVKDDYPEGVAPEGLFGEAKAHLRELLERLDKAAKDDKISGVVLRLREPDIGLAKVDELRAAVGRIRKAGKKVFADVHSTGTRDYLVAAACDQIIMPESGSVMINGVQAEVMFFKGLLDKLGIQADFIQIGDFKGASEPMTRTSMSPEFRKQYEEVINDYYEQIVQTISTDRKIEPEQVKKLIDLGMFSAEQARREANRPRGLRGPVARGFEEGSRRRRRRARSGLWQEEIRLRHVGHGRHDEIDGSPNGG